MSVFKVTLPGSMTKNGFPFFMNFECEHESVDSLIAALNEGYLVQGVVLHTDGDPRRERTLTIIRRSPVGFGRHGVARVELSVKEFVERDGQEDTNRPACRGPAEAATA